MEEIELLERRRPYRGRVVDLRVDRVRLPNGRVSELEVVGHPGGAAILPLLDDGSVLLLRQLRYATGGWLREIPAGKIADGESPASCARRELREETGYRARSLTWLGWVWTAPGFSDERIFLFLATGLEPGEKELDPSELLSVERLPLATALTQAESGGIVDAKTVCALVRASRCLA